MVINKQDYEKYFMVLSQIVASNTREDLLKHLHEITNSLGFHSYLINIELKDIHGKQIHHSLGSHPEEWQRINAEKSHTPFDPVVLHTQQSTTPLFWIEKNLHNEQCLPLLEESREYGLGNGISAAAYGKHGIKSIILLSTSAQNRYTLGEINSLKSVATVLVNSTHLALERIIVPSLVSPVGAHLTKQERDSLTWVANGKTAWEIGKIMNISESTVVFHIKNVLEKLGAANRQHAVAVAVRSGIID